MNRGWPSASCTEWLSWGRRISGPLGVALLLVAIAVMVEGSVG